MLRCHCGMYEIMNDRLPIYDRSTNVAHFTDACHERDKVGYGAVRLYREVAGSETKVDISRIGPCACGRFTLGSGVPMGSCRGDDGQFIEHRRDVCKPAVSSVGAPAAAVKKPAEKPLGVSPADSEQVAALKRQLAQVIAERDQARIFADRYKAGRIERVRQLRLHPIDGRQMRVEGGKGTLDGLDYIVDLPASVGHLVVIQKLDGHVTAEDGERRGQIKAKLGPTVEVCTVGPKVEVTVCEIVRAKE